MAFHVWSKCTVNLQNPLPQRVLGKRYVKGSIIGFHQQAQTLGLHTTKTVSCESTTEEVSFEW